MNKIIFTNAANFVVFLRSVLVFAIIIFLSLNQPLWNIIGFLVLIFIAILDWVDGYIARKYRISSGIGGLMDTLGDRITENILLIFFAYKHLIPVAVPIIFVARSFIADFIRGLAFRNGIDTFSINKSRLGIIFVASRTSRIIYLVFKIAIFLLCAFILVIQSLAEAGSFDLANLLSSLEYIAYVGSILLVIFNLLRFIFLIYDSRLILRNTFAR